MVAPSIAWQPGQIARVTDHLVAGAPGLNDIVPLSAPLSEILSAEFDGAIESLGVAPDALLLATLGRHAASIPVAAGCGQPLPGTASPEFWPNGPMPRASIAQLACAYPVTRLPAPPAQIAAADRLLHAVPMGNERLVTDVEPTAACVAALHWTAAAVDVTLAAVGGGDPAEVLEEAAAAEDVDVLAATAVLGMLRAGNPPLAVVQDLVSSAVLVGNGMVLDDDEFSPADPGHGPRTTLLHPSSPARALLDLLTGVVRACFTAYSEACDPAQVDGDGDWIDLTRERFDHAVREEADRRSDRLLQGCA